MTLLDKSSAVALMILHGDSIAASAGILSEQGCQSLKAALRRYWPDLPEHDLNRTVGLSLDNRFFLIFAKFLPEGSDLLGLVFPIQIPLIRIRQDMTNVQRGVVKNHFDSLEQKATLEQSLHVESVQERDHDLEPLQPSFNTEWHPEQAEEINQPKETSVEEEKNNQAEQPDRKASASPRRYLTYGAPMKDVPQVSQKQSEAEPEGLPWNLIDESTSGTDEDQTIQKQDTWQPLSDALHTGDDLINMLQDDYEVKEDLNDAQGWMLPSEDLLDTQFQPLERSSEEDTSPIIVPIKAAEWEEEISETTFYLVPGLESQHLVGELSRRLKEWLPAICERYGWQLTLLSVRPYYLKWTLSDFPESLTQKMLRVIRQDTTRRIRRVFPDLQESIQEGDYWAPGYLVDTQHRDLSTQSLFIHLSKNRMEKS